MPFQQFLHQEMQRKREGEEREQWGGSSTLQEQSSIFCCHTLLCKQERNLPRFVHTEHTELTPGEEGVLWVTALNNI